MAFTVTQRQLAAAALLMRQGIAASGAAALVGNFVQEVGATLPTAFRKTGLDHGSQGLAQWRAERLDAYKTFVREKYTTAKTDDETLWPWYGRLDYQCEFVVRELATLLPALDHRLRAGGDVAALTADVCWQYERPAKTLANLANRVGSAKALAAALANRAPHDPSVAIARQEQHHDAQVQAGSAAAGGALVLGVVVGGWHGLVTLDWWQIVCLGVLAFVFVVALIVRSTHKQAADAVAQTVVSNDPFGSAASVGANAPPQAKRDAQRREMEAAMRFEEQAAMEAAMSDKGQNASQPPQTVEVPPSRQPDDGRIPFAAMPPEQLARALQLVPHNGVVGEATMGVVSKADLEAKP